MKNNIKIAFRIIGIIFLIYVWHSKKALNITINISELIWGAVFALSLVIFLPISFIKSAKKWCSHWFNGTAILLFLMVLLKVKYLMMISGNDTFDSPIGFLVSLYKTTFGAGFNVYWPLLMTLAWGSGSVWFAERLERQYANYESTQKNSKLTNPKKKYVIASLIVASCLILFTTLFLKNKKNQQTKVKNVIMNAMGEYKTSGMTGLRYLSESNYGKLGKNPKLSQIQECVWVDVYAYLLDAEIGEKLGFPENEYFNAVSFKKRVNKYLLTQNLSDEKADEFFSKWSDEVIDGLRELEENGESLIEN